MNKKTKGAIAAGAAAVLLAGGAGTMAAWTASESVSGGTITAGELTVTQDQAGTWTWVGGAKDGEALAAGDLIVPGDAVSYTATYTLGIKGTNLTADLSVGTLDDGGLPAGLSFVTTGSTSNLTGLDESDDGKTVTVTGTLTFEGTATGSMNETVNLSDVAVTLKQTAPAVAS